MEKITATIIGIKFKNTVNGWTVLELIKGEADQESFTNRSFFAVGVLPGAGAGESVELEGEWVEHSEYGKQFKFETGSTTMPDSLEGIEKYLGSGVIKSIRAATARNIVRRFGEDTFEVLEKQPWRLSEIKGISPKRAETIAKSFKDQIGMRKSMMKLQEYGITINQSAKLYKLYGEKCVSIIDKNPYRMVTEIDGIGFKTADDIAMKMGFLPDSAFRIASGIKYTLAWAKQEYGHTCFPKDKLISTCASALDVGVQNVEDELTGMLLNHDLTVKAMDDGDYIYLNHNYKYDAQAAFMLTTMCQNPRDISGDRLEAELDALEAQSNIALDSMQRTAVLNAFENGVEVITGGPGTGKTTIINFILNLLETQGIECKLCAPTGRAAKRMSETTGREATTIHRLLEYDGEYFNRDADNKIECGALIIDEMSMVDAQLFYSLIIAIAHGTRVVMVGDADQLPSVGAGNVLRDIIDSQCVPVARLTEIFRQASQSRIIVNAHRINGGKMPLLDFTNDFGFEEISSGQDVLNRLAGMLQRGKLGNAFTDIQVLAPMKKGVLGMFNINSTLQNVLNPPTAQKKERAVGDVVFREGDKVMQVRNNYQLQWEKPTAQGLEQGDGVFNGDLGIIAAIDSYNKLVEIHFDDGRQSLYDYEQLKDVELAYCITIHKSQGSEFNTIVLPLHSGPPILMTRNLLYTAITRARGRVIVLGRQSAIEQMVNNNYERERYSGLDFCLRELNAVYKQEEV